MKMDKVPRKRKLAGKSSNRFNSKTTRGAKIVDSDEDLGDGPSSDKYGCLSKPEVTKLQDALRSSSSELHAMVKDPLPDALQKAKNIISNMSSTEKCVKDGPAPNVSSADKCDKDVQASNVSAAEKSADVGQSDKSNPGDKGGSQTNDPKPSLMTRNTTARTFEWDESLDGSADPTNRPHLPTPKQRVVSPLKRYDNPKQVRRKRKFWSNVEEKALMDGVRDLGVGNWKLILKTFADKFEERTEVDLKDKWRNMTR